jgi:pimeloyl-ACP methyl ester carboxylesterase
VGSKVRRLTKLAVLGLLGFVLILIGSGLAYRVYRHHEIAKATVIDTSKGIDESLFVKIGGIDQWVTFRGQERENPALLLLHGGPGVATSPYPRDVIFDWTKDFTLVQWDQRGAGKTYGKSGPLAAGVTIDQMSADGIEVAEFARQRLHKQKVILLGLSWGTILGVHMAKVRPDFFYAYVGTGQMVNEREGEAIVYRQVLDKARARNDRKAIKELQDIGPPPYDSQEKLAVQRKWGRAYEPGAPSNLSLIGTILFESPASFKDVKDYIAGVVDSQNHFFGENMSGPLNAVDLRALGTDFTIPIFVFDGAEDDVAPVRLAKAYIDSIVAPEKGFVAIPGAGHTALNTKSDEFLRLMDRWVRPLAIESQSAHATLNTTGPIQQEGQSVARLPRIRPEKF